MKKMPWYYLPVAMVLAVMAAVLQAYSFPPLKLGFLGWIALLPLIVVARIERPIVGCLCGLVAALTCGAICGGQWSESWQYGNLIAAFGSFGLVLASAIATASHLSKRIGPALWPFAVAAAGVTGELVGTNLFPVSISLSQFQNTAALNLASITGIWGVTYLLWLVPAGLVVAYSRVRCALPSLALAGLVLVGAWMAPPKLQGETVTVTAVQASHAGAAADQTRRIKGSPQVIVWPELVLNANHPAPASCAKSAGAYLAADFSEPNLPHKPYNSSFLFSPSGKRIGVFRKQHLFGKEVFSFTPGGPSNPVKTGDFYTAVAICFDTEFTDVTRDYVRRGAELIVVPNHDPEIPNSMFNHLHLAVIPFRAAENGVPIAWSESKGLSSIVDSNGRILAQAPVDTTTSVTADVHLRNRTTFFTRFGDFFAYLCAAVLSLSLLLSFRRAVPVL